jgi:hypothetical protein
MRETTVANGAFLFDGTTPGAGEPYPTELAWLRTSGTVIDSVAFPVAPGQYCP